MRAIILIMRAIMDFAIMGAKKKSPTSSGRYLNAPRVRADPTATLACDAQHTPLDRRWGKRTARGILPH